MRRKPFGIVSLLVPCVACSSLPPGAQPISADSPLVALGKAARTKCLSVPQGDFLAVASSEGVPPVTFEGVWTDGFETLTGRATTPLGDSLFELEVHRGTVRRMDLANDKSGMAQALVQAVTELGPRALRLVACGVLGLPVSSREGHLLPSDKGDLYQIEGTIEGVERTFQTMSRSQFAPEGRVLRSETTLRSGWFFKFPGVLVWEGRFDGEGGVTPASLDILPKEGHALRFTFVEFDGES